MLHPSPAGGFGELFPSPAKGHQDNPGLTDEQGAEAQALVNAALGGYYTRGETASLLAGKEPSIAEGSLAQSKIQSLTSDLAAKASSQQLADAIATREPIIAEGSLAQSKIQSLTSDLAARALQADLVSGLAGKVDSSTFAEANTQRITVDARLEERVAAKADAAETTAALATKADAEAVATRHPLITAEAPLSLSLIDGLQDALSAASTSAVN